MKYLFTVNLLASCILYCSGQSFDANSKAYGEIVTIYGKYEGHIDINLELNQALWSHGNEMKVFGARQIKHVKLTTHDRSHENYMGSELGDSHYLFEVVAEGQLTILYRNGLIKDDFTNAQYSGYFVKSPDGHLSELARRRDFLDAFGDDDKWMNLHIKNHNLDLDKKEDIREIFAYYNQSFEATHASP